MLFRALHHSAEAAPGAATAAAAAAVAAEALIKVRREIWDIDLSSLFIQFVFNLPDCHSVLQPLVVILNN